MQNVFIYANPIKFMEINSKNDIIKKLEQAKFINLDVPVRDIIEATNGVSSDMEYYDICPPLIRWHPPKRFGEDEVINQIKTLTENIKELNEKINGLTQR